MQGHFFFNQLCLKYWLVWWIDPSQQLTTHTTAHSFLLHGGMGKTIGRQNARKVLKRKGMSKGSGEGANKSTLELARESNSVPSYS